MMTDRPLKMSAKALAALGLILLVGGLAFGLRRAQGRAVAEDQGEAVLSLGAITAEAQSLASPTYLPLTQYDHPISTIFGYEYGAISEGNGLNEMRAAGANWVRRAGIWWPDVEPTKGTYNWDAMSGLESEFLLARAKNMRVIIVVRGTPTWAQADPPYDRECGRIKTSEFASFANFMSELVARYSFSPYDVLYWEIWNEPDVDPRIMADVEWMGCWGNQDEPYYGGGYYADMLKQVYPAVKAANPKAQVLVGGLLLDCDPNNPPAGKDCSPALFMEGILANNGGPYFDGVSFHAYDYNHSWLGGYYNSNWNSEWNTTGPVQIAKSQYLKGLLSSYSVTGKFLMNTEVALLCTIGDLNECETTKAYYVVHAYVTAMKEGLAADVWYFWMERNAGLLQADLTPLPAYDTYKFARNTLRDATYSQEITSLGAGVRAYELLDADGSTIWVLWSLDGATHSVTLPSTPDAIYDAFGVSQTPAATITVDLKPLYVVWNP